MQLNTILRSKNDIKSPKFKHLMRAKVRPIILFRWFGSGQRLAVRVPHLAILLQQYWYPYSWRAWSTKL